MRSLKNEQGQSTLEFIFSISFALFLIIYTVKVALNYTTGYLVHYSTYMASRAYLTFEGNGNPAGAEQIMRETFEGTKINLFNDSLGSGSDQLAIVDNSSTPQNVLLTGVRYDYETTFSSAGMFGGDQMLQLRSESYLGREPDRSICVGQTCRAALNGAGNSCGRAFTLVDNGC